MRSLRRSTASVVALVALTAGFVACSSDDDNLVDVTVAETTTTTTRPQVTGDGRLVIGALLPLTDPLLGEPMAEAVDIAVGRINTAGGVLDQRVQLIVADEGSSTATASASIQTLLDSDVDAVIGPASSLIALSTLDEIVSAGKVVCSPTASALALDGFPDDDLFFRTVPSDSLQARAIATAADQTGAQRVTIVFVDDSYGRPVRGCGRVVARERGDRRRRAYRVRCGRRRPVRRGSDAGRLRHAGDGVARRRRGRHEVPRGARRRRHEWAGHHRRERRTPQPDGAATHPGPRSGIAQQDRRIWPRRPTRGIQTPRSTLQGCSRPTRTTARTSSPSPRSGPTPTSPATSLDNSPRSA